jgi:hypothetical protein
MNLIFERGEREAPAGHALVYFRADDGAILATYILVPPIAFDLTKFMPTIMAGAMQGLEFGSAMATIPVPPIPEEVPGVEYLEALAVRRNDDLVFAGGTMHSDPMRQMADVSEAAREYSDLYGAAPQPEPQARPPEVIDFESARYAQMSEQEHLNELTALIGRLRESLTTGTPDREIERQIQRLTDQLPAKYRGSDLAAAASIPGERGQRLAELYLERSYKLYNEDYLDLERIDHEISALRE